MDKRTFDALELGTLIELVVQHVQTSLGRKRVLNLRPLTSRSKILRELGLTAECTAYLSAGKRFGFSGIDAPDPIVAQLQIEGTSLDPRQILVLEQLLSVSADLRELFKDSESRETYPRLSHIIAGIPNLRPLLASIRGKILPSGEIDDNASPELRALRKELTDRRTRIHRMLESILRGKTRAVQEEIVTFRNGRFVIPVRTDSRSYVPGVVHGLSSSGQTTFVEPLAAINQNNELVRLREQEEIEVFRILLSITESLRENLEAIRTIVEIVTELDFVQAKAVFGAGFKCVPPQISNGRRLALKDARHVLLEHSLRGSGDKTVPISLELDDDCQVLVVSGPNAGGKTVVVKTLGLISLMAQMGFHVPASEALLPIFDQVFADIGDQQSIAANLSTFTAHMRNVAEMAQQVHPPALILLDEVGTGTDPDEGAALAVSIVDYFRRAGATTVATTHYPGLKMWASQTAGVRNASVEFDERTLRPTYRLILGVAGASSGLEIARRMHVAEDILDAAKRLVEPSHAQAREYLQRIKVTLDEHETLRAALEQERGAVASKYSSMEMEFAKREAERKAEFGDALARAVREFTAESERSIQSIRDRVEAARIRKAAENRAADLRRSAERLRQNAEGSRPEQGASANSKSPQSGGATAKISEGDRVRIQPLNQEGMVESIRDGTYIVIVGSLRYRASREDLIRAAGSPSAEQPRSPAFLAGDETLDKVFVSELNVIGLTADEATERVDKFLDDAFLAGAESIRIIHGHGKGILRRAIAQLLKDHPQVEKFRLAPGGQGGGGATLVELRACQ